MIFISNNNKEVEFVLMNLDRHEEVISELREALASGFSGNIFYCFDRVLLVRKIGRSTIEVINSLHDNILRTHHVFLIIGLTPE